MSRQTVLYIEDSRENRELVRAVLTRRGFDVVTAISGMTGIQTALSRRPDLILVDLNLPDMDGYEVATRIRLDNNFTKTPIIALTASGDRDLSLTAGCDGFIEKPIDIDSFPALIQTYLDGRHDSVDSAVERDTLRRYNKTLVEKLEQKVSELIRANEQLEELDRLKNQFVQNVTHELATPLTPLVGYLKIIRNRQMGTLTQKQEKCLDGISSAVHRLQLLINNLLSVTRIQLGNIHLKHESLPVAAVVAESRKLVGHDFESKGISLECEIPENLAIDGDQALLVQVFQQILHNAAKFTPPGGRVRIRAESVDNRVRFSFEDSGIGIPSAELDRVFDLFYQVDGSTTRRFDGAGIGLSIARRIVDAHHGEIWAENPGSSDNSAQTGTRVVVELPAVLSVQS
ncbi:MAG: hybrid sensor histidine kinase/response regulator [Deltaproteobacteria bacterium]|nr:hybrid sensor histidine kinase/response regulator [Deltaproteobacteria bacterium]